MAFETDSLPPSTARRPTRAELSTHFIFLDHWARAVDGRKLFSVLFCRQGNDLGMGFVLAVQNLKDLQMMSENEIKKVVDVLSVPSFPAFPTIRSGRFRSISDWKYKSMKTQMLQHPRLRLSTSRRPRTIVTTNKCRWMFYEVSQADSLVPTSTDATPINVTMQCKMRFPRLWRSSTRLRSTYLPRCDAGSQLHTWMWGRRRMNQWVCSFFVSKDDAAPTMKRAPGHRRGSRPKGSRLKDQRQEVGHLDIFIVCEPISTDARLLPRPGIDKGYPDTALCLPWKGAASARGGSPPWKAQGGRGARRRRAPGGGERRKNRKGEK